MNFNNRGPRPSTGRSDPPRSRDERPGHRSYQNNFRQEYDRREEEAPEPPKRVLPPDQVIDVFGSKIAREKIPSIRAMGIKVQMLASEIINIESAPQDALLTSVVVYPHEGKHYAILRPAVLKAPDSRGIIDVALLSKQAVKKLRE